MPWCAAGWVLAVLLLVAFFWLVVKTRTKGIVSSILLGMLGLSSLSIRGGWGASKMALDLIAAEDPLKQAIGVLLIFAAGPDHSVETSVQITAITATVLIALYGMYTLRQLDQPQPTRSVAPSEVERLGRELTTLTEVLGSDTLSGAESRVYLRLRRRIYDTTVEIKRLNAG